MLLAVPSACFILLHPTLLPGIPFNTCLMNLLHLIFKNGRDKLVGHKAQEACGGKSSFTLFLSHSVLPGGSYCSLCVLPEILWTNKSTHAHANTYFPNTSIPHNTLLLVSCLPCSSRLQIPSVWRLGLFFPPLPTMHSLYLEQCPVHSRCSINLYNKC